MRIQHWQECEAPICSDTRAYDDKNWKKNVTWFPDEKICMRSPYTKFQKMQLRLQKLLNKGLLKFPNTYYTAYVLENRTAIHPGTKGLNPERQEASK